MVNVCYQLGVECIEVLDYVIPQTDIGSSDWQPVQWTSGGRKVDLPVMTIRHAIS